MNRRSETRINKSFLAFTNIKDPEFFGVISNISRKGFLIESLTNFSPGDELSLAISLHNELYIIKGEVKWTNISNTSPNKRVPCRMGVKVTEAPAEYLNFIEYLSYQHPIKNTNENIIKRQTN